MIILDRYRLSLNVLLHAIHRLKSIFVKSDYIIFKLLIALNWESWVWQYFAKVPVTTPYQWTISEYQWKIQNIWIFSKYPQNPHIVEMFNFLWLQPARFQLFGLLGLLIAFQKVYRFQQAHSQVKSIVSKVTHAFHTSKYPLELS